MESINWRIESWFPSLSPFVLDMLKRYHSELLKFNSAVNLISRKSEFDADLIHFADSLIGSKIVIDNLESDTIYDLGSGNGFPGIVLSILRPELNVILVDSDSRKAEFLRYMTTQLGLKKSNVLCSRVESIQPNQISCAVSRGFASIGKSILSSRDAFSKNGKYFHFKGSNWITEVSQIPSQLCRFWTPASLGEYQLPIGDGKYSIIQTTKL